MERLSKLIAQSGVSSRRKAEELILAGKVKVNGEVITQLGTKANQSDLIEVDGKVINKERLVYFLINKPTGYLSTNQDEHKRRNFLDLMLPEDKQFRLFPVAKLEYDTAGALLVTNDGELTRKLTRRVSGIEKEYMVRVSGIMIKEKIRQMRNGISVEGKIIQPREVQLMELDKKNQSTLVRIVIGDETNKEIRALFKTLEHPVKNLTRTRYDFLTLEGVERGGYRPLRAHEVKRLYREIS
ncbi:pseudouridine synthase [Acholeplasma hippikon]|nr:pseudouridine synthase [Acholeplasma hippikon]